MREDVIAKSSIVEIQNLTVNPKSWPIKSNSEQYKFLFKYISSKYQSQNFSKKKKEKTLFWGHFWPKGIVPKNSSNVQLQGFPNI